MTEKVAGTIAVLAVILVGGYVVYHGLEDSPRTSEVPEEVPLSGITFAFDPAGADESGAPKTTVSVVWGGKSYDAGTYQGNCFSIADSAWELVPGEESGAICWWAGAGTEIGIFPDGNDLAVKRGYIEEGSAEVEGSRGSFTTLFLLKEDKDSVVFKTRLNQQGGGLGVLITPLSILEDSRCPTDVACIQAGTVRVNARVRSGGQDREAVFTLGIVETGEKETITLVAVEPAKVSTSGLEPSEYRLTFGIEKRGE
ncbi:MAG: hypothetical protein KBD05_03355 [Candidatus Pacebacteria bacterium]|nr:hypothetical protein [Candidatus Paceibacterota bacterium]